MLSVLRVREKYFYSYLLKSKSSLKAFPHAHPITANGIEPWGYHTANIHFPPTNGYYSEADQHLALNSCQADVMLRTNYFRWCPFHPYPVPSPGCRLSQSHWGPSWSGCLSLVSFKPEGTCWPWSVSLDGGCSVMCHLLTIRDPSPSAPEKEECLVFG